MLDLCAQGRFGASLGKSGWCIQRIPFDRPTLKPRELATIIGVSWRFVLRLCEDGRIRSIKVGKQWRIDFGEAMNFVKNRNQEKRK